MESSAGATETHRDGRYSHYAKVLVIRSVCPLANTLSSNNNQHYTTTKDDTFFKPIIQSVLILIMMSV
jgi:hypothetical protein